jgi:hypothetical protein
MLIDKALQAAGWSPILRYVHGASYDTAAVEEYQTAEGPDAEALDIPIHAFDCIIADECHRGYTSTEESKWWEVLDHFDGVKIGLTATPAPHTKAYLQDIREAIRAVVRCVRPDIRQHSEFTIHDPACGTAGFLIGAYEWLEGQTREGADLRREDRERLQKRTVSGGEIVLETRRLGLMNLYLHEIDAKIYYGDSLAEGPHAATLISLIRLLAVRFLTSAPSRKAVLRSTGDAAAYFQAKLKGLPEEEVHVAFVNAKNAVTATVGVRFLDHLIIGDSSPFSFKAHGLL